MKDITKLRDNLQDKKNEVSVSISSKRYTCSLELKSKFTRIVGDSGRGKTMLSRVIAANQTVVEVSNDYRLVILTTDRFYNSVDFALRHNTNGLSDLKFLKEYWSDQANNPYANCILLIDDEEFVKTEEFAIYYNCDRQNLFLCIERDTLPQINYSPLDIYEFMTNGVHHWIQNVYDFEVPNEQKEDLMLIEGIGSDYIFFDHMYKDREISNPCLLGQSSGGKSSLLLAFKSGVLDGKTINLIVDFISFGSCMEQLQDICNSHNICILFNSKYLSFEYMLLKSNIIKDNIDNILEEKRFIISNIEKYCTERLCNLTKDTLYAYSKSEKSFSACYYMDCCTNKGNRNNCKYRMISSNFSDKFEWLLDSTEFAYFLERR